MFIENGYEVRKNVISKEIPDLAYHYYKLKVENNEVGIDNYQVPGTIILYGDTLGDAILRWTLPLAQGIPFTDVSAFCPAVPWFCFRRPHVFSPVPTDLLRHCSVT